MKKVLALVVAAAMGLSSAAFAAETTKPAAEQKAQAAKKHTKKAATKPAATKPAAEQKAQAAKKHTKKAVKHETAKPVAQPAA